MFGLVRRTLEALKWRALAPLVVFLLGARSWLPIGKHAIPRPNQGLTKHEFVNIQPENSDAPPRRRMNRRTSAALLAGPIIASCVGLVCLAYDAKSEAAWCAAITTLCAVWWVTEAIPIPATSMLPFALFPLTGVLSEKAVAGAYGHRLILLLLGGFMLSRAMESSGAHRRLALGMVRAVGGSGGRRLVLGFMTASAVLSMWISNSATTLMLLPVAMAVLEQSRDDKLALPLLLGVAYAANVGGIGTPVGTPPNLVFKAQYMERVDPTAEITFLSWMKIGVPVVVILVPLAWLWLSRRLGPAEKLTIPHPGKWRPAEVRVLTVFGLTAIAWVTRSEPFGGWSSLLSQPEWVGDGTVALVAVCAMFLIPDGTGNALLDWQTAVRIPWGLLLLFGGGLAIAAGFQETGLSVALGKRLSLLATWPSLPLIFIVALTVTFLTELTSNTATTTLLMPVLAEAGRAAGIEPALLMVPAAVSASCAFMLPVATAPNAIVFGSGRLTVKDMVKQGFVLNLVGAVVTTLLCYFLLRDWP